MSGLSRLSICFDCMLFPVNCFFTAMHWTVDSSGTTEAPNNASIVRGATNNGGDRLAGRLYFYVVDVNLIDELYVL